MNPGTDSPVYGFLRRASMVDYPGRLSAVFFVSGCNFRCGFCHNPDLMRNLQRGLTWTRLEDACRRFAEQWVDAAVITGGEPTLSEDLGTLIATLKRRGWSVKLDTNGSRPDVLADCLPACDYVAMDVKAGLGGYAALTGFTHTEAITESIRLIRNHARDYEFRTTVVAPFHDDEQMGQIRDMVRGAKRYILQPFIPKEGLPDPRLETCARTSPDRMRELLAFMQGCAEEVSARGT